MRALTRAKPRGGTAESSFSEEEKEGGRIKLNTKLATARVLGSTLTRQSGFSLVLYKTRQSLHSLVTQ